jgi:hypothetical protein
MWLPISAAGDIGGGFKRVFDLLSIVLFHLGHFALIGFIACLSCYRMVWPTVFKHVGRANTPSFYDECLDQGVVLAQSHVGSVSVSNRRRGLG